jgi:natural product biosynthesis luciferase-like monooxygenase protein
MNFQSKRTEDPIRALIIGNESLVIQCAEIWQKSGHDVGLIVTRNADVASWAKTQGVQVLQHAGALGDLDIEGDFDWLLSIANLQIIPQALLGRAGKGAVNFHDGPLPRYAGLNAPVWARANGEAEHGISWHLIEDGVDEGDILVQRSFPITEGDTALTLNTKCFSAAIDSFPDVVAALEAEGQPRRKQDLTQRSYFGLTHRPEAAGRLDFRKSASEIVSLVRALDHGSYDNPLCCPKISAGGRVLLVGAAESTDRQGVPGQVLDVTADTITVAVQGGAVHLSEITDQDGGAVALQTIVAAGQSLPVLEKTDGLDKAIQAVAKHDAFWQDRLQGMVAARLPLIAAANEQPDWISQNIATPEGMSAADLIAAIGLWAERSGVEAPAHFAYCQDGMSHAAGYLSPWVPLSLNFSVDDQLSDIVAGFAAEQDLVSRKDTFALDIVARNEGITAIAAPDVAIISDPDAGPIDGVALNFMLGERGMRLRYDRNRVDEDHAARLVARLELVATQVAAGNGLVKDLLVLPEAERKSLLEDWNDTATEVDFDLSIHAAIARQAAETPDAVAVVFEHDQLTYAELDARANQTANVLRDMGVAKGDVVGVHCKRSLDLVVACLGALKAGAAYLPLDPAFPEDRIAIYVEDSAAKFIISQQAIASDLPKSAAQVLEIDNDPRLSAAAAAAPADTVVGTDLAYLIFTSGSTGRPKGVMVEHRNVANFFAGMDARIPHDPAGTWLAVTSLSFDISVLELFYTLARGFKLVISGDESATQISNGAIGTSDKGMEFSLYYWGNDDGVGQDKYRSLLEGARFADDHGFCAIWTPERHFHAFGGPYPNPSVTGAAVAGFTKNIGVRAGSCVGPLHHTARIAEEWAVIDNLTNGRAGLAIASGWQPDDFVLRPENTPPANKPAMFEQIEDLRKLWRGEAVEFPRKDGSKFPVKTQPRPVSKELPVWVTTAGNPDTWKEAGRIGANVLTHLLGQSVEEVAEKIELYHAALRSAGFDPDNFKVTLMLHTFVGDDRETVREIAREPMKDYLRSAAGLIKQYAWAFPAFKRPEGVNNPFELDLGSLNDEELEGILDFAFLRYFEDSGLFGTIEDCLTRVEEIKRIGVSEIACLIDYGIDTDEVLEGLKPLAKVVEAANRTGGVGEDDVSIAGQIVRHNVTHLQCTPSMARMLAMNEEAGLALSKVQHLMIGGEALSGQLVLDLNALTRAGITNMYGPTETTIWSSTAQARAGDGTVDIGTPIANTGLYVLDDAMKPVPMGVPGELYIGGAGVTRGYWQRPELTAERFVDSPFADGDRLYRTGDLVRARLDGSLDFIGRADHQVKLRGYRIELGEIESRLEDLPQITQAVVIPREDVPGDMRLVAYLIGGADENAMRAHLQSCLPDYMVPSHFVTMDSFPLTPNKKVDRKQLPVPEKRKRSAEVAEEAPTAGVAADVAEIWKRTLGVDRVSASDNFFDLGGHSLLAVQAHREIRDKLGHSKVSITDIFRFPTLGGLTERLEKLGGGAITKTSEPIPATTEADEGQTKIQARQDAMSKRRAMRARRREKSS